MRIQSVQDCSKSAVWTATAIRNDWLPAQRGGAITVGISVVGGVRIRIRNVSEDMDQTIRLAGGSR